MTSARETKSSTGAWLPSPDAPVDSIRPARPGSLDSGLETLRSTGQGTPPKGQA